MGSSEPRNGRALVIAIKRVVLDHRDRALPPSRPAPSSWRSRRSPPPSSRPRARVDDLGSQRPAPRVPGSRAGGGGRGPLPAGALPGHRHHAARRRVQPGVRASGNRSVHGRRARVLSPDSCCPATAGSCARPTAT
jgi:hypothetical protein